MGAGQQTIVQEECEGRGLPDTVRHTKRPKLGQAPVMLVDPVQSVAQHELKLLTPEQAIQSVDTHDHTGQSKSDMTPRMLEQSIETSHSGSLRTHCQLHELSETLDAGQTANDDSMIEELVENEFRMKSYEEMVCSAFAYTLVDLLCLCMLL